MAESSVVRSARIDDIGGTPWLLMPLPETIRKPKNLFHLSVYAIGRT
jgi:hypothetical protein